MRIEQKLMSGVIVRQDISDAIRPVFFQTDYEDFLYATHGGTLFVVRFRGRTYALTCNHVFKDFPNGRLLLWKKHAEKGSLPARIEGIRFASGLRGVAIDSDIGDVCAIEFSNENPSNFFGDSPYLIDEETVATAAIDDELFVHGVLKDKTSLAAPELTVGYCSLQFLDRGPHDHDPTLRRASALFHEPEFETVTGISGSPVFNKTANALCGMVVRGGMSGHSCEMLYVDIFDIAFANSECMAIQGLQRTTLGSRHCAPEGKLVPGAARSADPAMLRCARETQQPAPKRKRGRHGSRPFPHSACCCHQPFVTTGGGGVAQPATVASVSTAMIARASFFIAGLPRP